MPEFKPAPFSFVFRTMMRYGHSAAEPVRSKFIYYLLSFADLDDHPCRNEVEAAFLPNGDLLSRTLATCRLAKAGLLGKDEYRFAIRQATRRRGNRKNIDLCLCHDGA